jgi:hypothetical protein
VIVLDMPGMTSSAEARRSASGESAGTGQSHALKILHEAEEDTRAGRYRAALEKHVWFHRNALEQERALAGVRLSFALSAWFRLARVYPPALAALKQARDEALETFNREHANGAFAEFVAINRTLGEEDRTVGAFVELDKRGQDQAAQVYRRARPALIKAKEYALCGKYLKPKEDLSLALEARRAEKDMAKENGLGAEFDRVSEQEFTNETATLIALLVVNGRGEEAKDIANAARDEWDDPAFSAAVEKALKGAVPEPWPPPPR